MPGRPVCCGDSCDSCYCPPMLTSILRVPGAPSKKLSVHFDEIVRVVHADATTTTSEIYEENIHRTTLLSRVAQRKKKAQDYLLEIDRDSPQNRNYRFIPPQLLEELVDKEKRNKMKEKNQGSHKKRASSHPLEKKATKSALPVSHCSNPIRGTLLKIITTQEIEDISALTLVKEGSMRYSDKTKTRFKAISLQGYISVTHDLPKKMIKLKFARGDTMKFQASTAIETIEWSNAIEYHVEGENDTFHLLVEDEEGEGEGEGGEVNLPKKKKKKKKRSRSVEDTTNSLTKKKSKRKSNGRRSSAEKVILAPRKYVKRSMSADVTPNESKLVTKKSRKAGEREEEEKVKSSVIISSYKISTKISTDRKTEVKFNPTEANEIICIPICKKKRSKNHLDIIEEEVITEAITEITPKNLQNPNKAKNKRNAVLDSCIIETKEKITETHRCTIEDDVRGKKSNKRVSS